jgi:hypothetical protein
MLILMVVVVFAKLPTQSVDEMLLPRFLELSQRLPLTRNKDNWRRQLHILKQNVCRRVVVEIALFVWNALSSMRALANVFGDTTVIEHVLMLADKNGSSTLSSGEDVLAWQLAAKYLALTKSRLAKVFVIDGAIAGPFHRPPWHVLRGGGGGNSSGSEKNGDKAEKSQKVDSLHEDLLRWREQNLNVNVRNLVNTQHFRADFVHFGRLCTKFFMNPEDDKVEEELRKFYEVCLYQLLEEDKKLKSACVSSGKGCDLKTSSKAKLDRHADLDNDDGDGDSDSEPEYDEKPRRSNRKSGSKKKRDRKAAASEAKKSRGSSGAKSGGSSEAGARGKNQ